MKGNKIKRFFGSIFAVAVSLAMSFSATTPVLADSWVMAPNGSYYYFYDNGTFATNTTIGVFTVGPTGALTPAEVQRQANEAMLKLAQSQKPVVQATPAVPVSNSNLAAVCSSIVSRTVNPSSSDIEKIRALFDYMLVATEYQRTYDTPMGDWTPAYALQCLTTGRGNCHRYAAGLAALLKAAGFQSRVATGSIRSSRGGLTPHSWTEVNVNGSWFIVDADMQDAKKAKYNFFMVDMNTYPVKPLVPSYYSVVNF